MAGFLYYIPGIDKADHDVLYKHGLAYAFADKKGNPTVNAVTGGPDGGHGAIVPGVGCSDYRYKPNEQTWRKYKDIHVGYWTDKKPKPADLLRDDALNGHAVKLGDGNQWIVPVARALAENDDGQLTSVINVPNKIDLDEDGNWIYSGVIDRCKCLLEIATPFWNNVIAGMNDQGVSEISMVDELNDAVQILQFNYAIGKIEAVMLGLIQNDSPREILEALVDLPTLRDWTAKKKSQKPSDG